MDGATFLKRFSFCVFMSLQLTACLEEEGEKKSTNSSSSSPSSGGGGGGGSTTPASILDSATANFKFAVTETLSATSANQVDITIPSASSPAVDQSSMISTLTASAVPTVGSGTRVPTSNQVRNSSTGSMAPFQDLSGNSRSHTVKITTDATTCSGTNLTCAVNSVNAKQLDITAFDATAFTKSITKYQVSAGSTVVEVPANAFVMSELSLSLNDTLRPYSGSEVIEVGNYYLYAAYKSESGTITKRLWKVHKSTLATDYILNTGEGGSVELLTLFGSDVFFRAKNSGGAYQLMKYKGSDGTIENLSASNGNLTDPRSFEVFNNNLYFSAKDSSSRYRLFKISSTGTISQLSNQCTGDDGFYSFKATSTALFTVGADSSNCTGSSVVVKIGLDGSMTPLNSLATVVYSLSSQATVNGVVEYNGKIYYSAGDVGNGYGIYRIDSNNVVKLVPRMFGWESSPSYSAHKIALAGNYIYVLDTDGKRLYRLDPSTDTTLNIVFDSTYLPTPDVEDMVSFNNQIYIRANNGGNYRKLFRVNPSDMASYYVADMTGSSGQDWPKNFMIFDGSLYFFMNNASGSTRLFHIDTAGGLYESNSYGLEGITTTVVAPSGILMIDGGTNRKFYRYKKN